MSKHRPGTKGYLIEHVESGELMYLVGARDETDPKAKYDGPQASVTWDDTWLNIMTDKYEGHVMLNIEALESLRKALAKVSRKIKTETHQQT
jgi:putative heme degradation protein